MMTVLQRPSLASSRVAAVFCLLLLGVSSDAFALRCGSKLVTEGMHIGEVLAACGEPAVESTRRVFIEENPPVLVGGRRVYRRNADGLYVTQSIGPITREVEIIEFTYNFGPRKFMRLLEFRNGYLADIRDLGYGYYER